MLQWPNDTLNQRQSCIIIPNWHKCNILISPHWQAVAHFMQWVHCMRYSTMCIRIPDSPKDLPSSEVTGMFSQLEIRLYRKPVNSRPTLFKNLFPHDHPDIPNPHLGIALNVLRQRSFTLGLQPSECPFWSGFMQIVNSNVKYAKSQIITLPFINHDPSNRRTIYTALCFAEKLIDQYGLGFCPVTFDQPLYAKAREIVESSTDLRKRFVGRGDSIF